MAMQSGELVYLGYEMIIETDDYCILRKPGEQDACVFADGSVVYGVAVI